MASDLSKVHRIGFALHSSLEDFTSAIEQKQLAIEELKKERAKHDALKEYQQEQIALLEAQALKLDKATERVEHERMRLEKEQKELETRLAQYTADKWVATGRAHQLEKEKAAAEREAAALEVVLKRYRDEIHAVEAETRQLQAEALVASKVGYIQSAAIESSWLALIRH